MSVFHRIDDIRAMPAQRLIDFALRLFAYKGVVRALAEAEHYEQEYGSQASSSSTTQAAASAGRNRVVASDSASLASEFGGIIETKRS